jgi:hypothetical protein
VGNLGRNTFVGPGYWAADTSLFKNFRISERYRLQFRAEAFNIFNHTEWSGYPGTFGGDNLFQYNAAHLARILQLGLKFSF